VTTPKPRTKYSLQTDPIIGCKINIRITKEVNMQQIYGTQFAVSEWAYRTARPYADPFNEVVLDVDITGPGGQTWRIPAYWAGGQEWRVRFAPAAPGTYTLRSQCSIESDPDLHGQTGELLAAEAAPETNTLMRRGPLRPTADGRTLEHTDGTPFFWLGDTWWMGLCQRLAWPAEFQQLTADRVGKGFTVVQIVAGLYPDMPGFDPRGANEAGFPWEDGYARINPAYFDMADLRIAWLVRSGLLPCVVGCWGYYLPLLGPEKMQQHWRYLVARWGAYPVVWCLAGEAEMPYYLSSDKEGDRARQNSGWTEIARYLRAIDPLHHLITIHPTQIGRDQISDDSLLDLNMLQTGHGGPGSPARTITLVQRETARQPHMPTLVSEVSYEGFLHYTGAEVQRLTFWSSVLSGAAGHTYGANGIWQVNQMGKPYGPSPHGGTWGNQPWQEAAALPGSTHLGLAKGLLDRFEWWRLEPHQEWVEPCGSAEHPEWPFAAGIPGKLRLIYFYGPNFAWDKPFYVQGFEPGSAYHAALWDPRTGQEYPLGPVQPDPDGRWSIPPQPEFSDWLLILTA
jgi:hypothetical protein